MGRAKNIQVAPIASRAANAFIKANHYSGKVVQNSQLHFGVWLDDHLGGVMQFGPSMDKSKIVGLVRSTGWNGFIELIGWHFPTCLPRNSESRALSVAMRLIKAHYPHIEWVVSFADATQCGDGTIYRASGFVLTGIKENNQIIEFPDGLRDFRLNLTDPSRPKRRDELAARYGATLGGGASLKAFLDIGAKVIPGFQLRYIRFLNPSAIDRLTVPVLPFSKIDELGAGMYLGKPRGKQAMDGSNHHSGGAAPTATLQRS